MYELVLFFLIGLVALIWYVANQGRERALFFARAECRKHQCQLLDQTVQFERYHLRWKGVSPTIWRTYRFDYSIEGLERQDGVLWFQGPRLVRVVMRDEEMIVH